MNSLDFEKLEPWCRDHGYELDRWIPRLPGAATTLECSIPKDVQQVPTFLDEVTHLSDSGRILWIRDWTIWTDRSQEMGLAMLDQLAAGISGGRNPSPSRVYLLKGSEWCESVSLLSVVVLFGWDAHVLFDSGGMLVDISHHGTLTASFRHGFERRGDRLKHWS